MTVHQSLINGIFRKLGGGNLIKFIFNLLPPNAPILYNLHMNEIIMKIS